MPAHPGGWGASSSWVASVAGTMTAASRAQGSARSRPVPARAWQSRGHQRRMRQRGAVSGLTERPLCRLASIESLWVRATRVSSSPSRPARVGIFRLHVRWVPRRRVRATSEGRRHDHEWPQRLCSGEGPFSKAGRRASVGRDLHQLQPEPRQQSEQNGGRKDRLARVERAGAATVPRSDRPGRERDKCHRRCDSVRPRPQVDGKQRDSRGRDASETEHKPSACWHRLQAGRRDDVAQPRHGKRGGHHQRDSR